MAMRPHRRYALLGVLLGLGAPLGSLAWSMVMRPHGDLISSLTFEWISASYYYLYMTVGTIFAFSLFGYMLGQRNEDLNDLSMTDGLTGIFNHRYLHEQLAREIQRSNRYGTPLTCLMLDIDDFKRVNDLHGHPFGDEVLATAARHVREAVRQVDTVGRYGGEEFLVIMPQTGGAAALPIAERILNTIQDHSFATPEGEVKVTLSIGLATYPAPDLGIKTKKKSFVSSRSGTLQSQEDG